MKNFKILLSIFLLTLFIVSCEEDDQVTGELELARDVTLGNVQSSVFNLLDLDNAAVVFDLGLSESGAEIQKVEIFQTFNGGNPELVSTITTVPATVSIPLTDAVAKTDKTKEELVPGDLFFYSFKLTLASGKVVLSSSFINGNAACPSDIGGTVSYTYVSANSPYWGGVSVPDGEIEISPIDAFGNYTISDASFGGLVHFYGVLGAFGATPVNISMIDVCNSVTFSGVDVYGDTYTWTISDISGSSMTVTWLNTYGDTGTVIATRNDGSDWPAGLVGG